MLNNTIKIPYLSKEDIVALLTENDFNEAKELFLDTDDISSYVSSKLNEQEKKDGYKEFNIIDILKNNSNFQEQKRAA